MSECTQASQMSQAMELLLSSKIILLQTLQESCLDLFGVGVLGVILGVLEVGVLGEFSDIFLWGVGIFQSCSRKVVFFQWFVSDVSVIAVLGLPREYQRP